MKEIDIDNTLIRQIQNGDKDAFRTLFMKYFAKLCAFVHTIVRSNEKAEDVVQKVFVKFWEKRKIIQISQTVFGYLLSACKNESFNLMKTEKTRERYEQIYVKNYKHIIENEAKLNNDKPISEIVNKAIEELPEKCKNIFKLSKQEGLSYQEIATYLSVSEKTVENQIGIALKKLRESLKPHIAIINE